MKIKIKNPVYGVPITIIDKVADDGFIHCSRNGNLLIFEILNLDRYMKDNPNYGKRFTLKGKETFAKIMIKKYENEN